MALQASLRTPLPVYVKGQVTLQTKNRAMGTIDGYM